MPDVGTLPVISLDVLNADECARWSERVLALKSHWTARDPDLPFFTLGLAAYCDASPDEVGAPYRVESYRQWNNRLLVKHFGALLEQCCQALASATGARRGSRISHPPASPGLRQGHCQPACGSSVSTGLWGD
jgi:hypothetical protein